jgi:putative transposase
MNNYPVKIHKSDRNAPKMLGYKYRFYPTKTQEQFLAQSFGCVRVVYNQTLAWRKQEFMANGTKVNQKMMSKFLTNVKTNQKFNWLNNVSSVALQQSLRHLHDAYVRFFKKQNEEPTFKKRKNHQSMTLASNAFKFENNQLSIAKCEQPLNIRWTRPLSGNVQSITISKDCANRYFVSFCCKNVEVKSIPVAKNYAIGIDLGLTDFLITSDGEKIKPLKALIMYQQKLAQLQRALSRKVKHSNNYNKARVKVAQCHNKIADSRKDFLHKLSSRLINENQVICLEDLSVANMMKNHKLAKAIADASWSEFVKMVIYKAKLYGRTIVQVSPWYPSSQICHHCDTNNGKKLLSVRQWTCKKCGTTVDRDINSGKNIKTAGLAGLACEAKLHSELSVEAGLPAL